MADTECEVSKLQNRRTRTLAHHVRVTAVVSRVVLLRITIIYLATTGRSIGSHIYANLHLFVPSWGQAMGYLIKRDRTMVQENILLYSLIDIKVILTVGSQKKTFNTREFRSAKASLHTVTTQRLPIF